MNKILVTGGSGFFGGLLLKELLDKGFDCVNIDLVENELKHPRLLSVVGDIRDISLVDKLFKENVFNTVFHCAAILAHAVKNKKFLWGSNVDGTRIIAEACKKYQVQKLIFTSSNCLWAKNFYRPVREDDIPEPVEIYGKSKYEAEKILKNYSDSYHVVIFRCPTIMDEGRLGLLGILFEFMEEGRKVWVVGGGDNRYQFIYAGDLIQACLKAMDYRHSEIFNIGSDYVKTFKEVYQYVIDKSGTHAVVASLPRKWIILAMKIAFFFKLSPLGPYQYKMIAEDFIFDTVKIKAKLNWKPTLTNEEMLYRAYQYFHTNLSEIKTRKNASAHRQTAKMGIIKVLKWLS